MERKTGIHFYINIKNLNSIIREEEDKDDDLKRTLHRLQTYFTGLTKLINDDGKGKIEKYTSGRAHIVFELEEENEKIDSTILESICKSYIYVNKIFNELRKYSRYTKFIVHGGIDYGDYYDYEIVDEKVTSIGSVANVSAKIQSFATKNHLFATKNFINKLDNEFKDKFIRLDDDEYKELYEKVKISNIYDIKYSDLFSDEKLNELEDELSDIKAKVKEESNKLNLSDIEFEGVSQKLCFDGLSLGSKNKKIEECIVVCADIRGFTKLFNNSGSNLDDLKDVMENIYSIMGNAVNDFDGTLVQYQGDRVVILYHDFKKVGDYIVRGIEAAIRLKDDIEELSEDYVVKEKLKNRKIGIGIGCSIGNTIATRLGKYGSKDNIILGESYKYADKAEDYYADKKQVVIWKELKEKIKDISENEENDNIKYEVLDDLFSSISTTGYYYTDITFKDYNEKVKVRESEKESLNRVVEQISHNEKGVRPWSE